MSAYPTPAGSEEEAGCLAANDARDAKRYRAMKKRHGYLMVVRLLGEDGYRSHMKDAQIDAFADLAIYEIENDRQPPDALELLETLASYMDSFREDGLRPDEWLLKEWAEKARAAVARATSPSTLKDDGGQG